jgi:hypothetical protein
VKASYSEIKNVGEFKLSYVSADNVGSKDITGGWTVGVQK